MSAKPKETTGDVVAVTGKHKLVGKRQLIWGGIALAVIVLGLAAYFAFRPYHAPQQPKAASNDASQYEAQPLQKSINKFNANGDYAGAVALAEKEAGSDTPSQLVMAAAYSNNKQYDKSMAVYDSLIKANKLTSADILVAGEVAQIAGDKGKAIGYFQKAKDKALQENDPFTKRQVNYADRQLEELKK